MNGINRDRLAANLKRIAFAYCAYCSPVEGLIPPEPELERGLCDCKFISSTDVPVRIAQKRECYCGCPEVSEAAAIIAAMSKKDFAKYAKKAKISIG